MLRKNSLGCRIKTTTRTQTVIGCPCGANHMIGHIERGTTLTGGDGAPNKVSISLS